MTQQPIGRGPGAHVDTSTPELRKHIRAIEAGNRLEAEWMADERLEELVGFCDLVVSHAISAREGAWRRDRAVAGVHLGHARGALILALKFFNSLPSDASGKWGEA